MQRVYTSDIGNFWTAYDSIQSTQDYSAKIEFINKLYIDKGTKGLKAFMEARDYNDTLWIKLINKYPKFWNSVRSNTLLVKEKTAEIEKAIDNFKILYPALKDAEMYFTIGGLSSGGTVTGNMVLIGCEIAAGDPSVDVSEFPNDWLKNVFKEQSTDNIVSLNIHEYVHTQQKQGGENLLAQSIREGSADFISELVTKKPLKKKYLTYGSEHAEQIKEEFKKDMYSTDFKNWLYNGSQKGEQADLGYYTGYEICNGFYENSENKSEAIKEIIELDFDSNEAVSKFFEKSKY